jgi:hypothetical protein
MTKEIQLTRGAVALVDDADYEWLSAWNWRLITTPKLYAGRSGPRSASKRETILMHRLIAAAPAGYDVDHINGDRLDNRRANLRICLHAENQRNMQARSDKRTSLFKGVNWASDRGKWRSRLVLNGQEVFDKYFDSEEDAARARDDAAILHHGQFARLNFER